VTGPRLVFSQCYLSDHFLVLFYAPWASLISFSIPTLAAGAGTILSRAGYIQSMLNTLISPHDSLGIAALMAYVAWIQRPRRLQHCERCTPCTIIKSVKYVRCQSSLIDCLIASTRRLGIPISPDGSNRTICVGPNCWIISWTIPC
jgi:hypothetical protein